MRHVWARLPENRFVLRTDVKSYYASIDHFLLLDQLAEHVKDRHVLNLLGQYLRRTSERGGQFYVRFMDDILVLAPTRWTLRRAVKAVNAVLASLRLEKHPDKTFIGRIERGFDFLGYHFSRDGLTVAKATIRKFVERASRLYEQERERPKGPSPLGVYVRRWNGWVKGGLEGHVVSS